MWFKIFKFELKYRIGQPDLYVYFLGLLLCSLVSIDFIFEGQFGSLKENSPYVIAFSMVITSLFFFMVISLLAGFSILKDFEHRMESLMFSNPIKKRDYLLGRFLGSLVIVLFVYLGLLIGTMLNYYMPWKSTEDLLSYEIWHYVQPFLFFIVPNIIIATTIFFVAAALGRKLLIVYTQGIFLLVGYILLMSYSGPIENEWFLSVIDPFAVKMIKTITDVWTPLERNQQLLPTHGFLLYNRVVWIGISIGIFLVGYRYFDFTVVRKHLIIRKPEEDNSVQNADMSLPRRQAKHGWIIELRKLLHQAFFYFRSIAGEVPFIAIMLCGALIIFVNGISLGTSYGVPSFPTTYLIVEELQELSIWFFLLIMIFYSGEIIWKERQVRMDTIYDALPTMDWSNLLAKYFGLIMTYMVMMVALIVSGVSFQILNGFYDVQMNVYLTAFFMDLLLFLSIYTALAIFLQVLVNHKYVGFMVTFVSFLLTMFLAAIGFDHSLINFGGNQLATYSEMNGYGHLLTPFLWVKAYWLSFCFMLLVIGVMLIARGTETSLNSRIKAFRSKITPAVKIMGLMALTVFLITGGYIYYNVNVLNTYATKWDQNTQRVAYERSLKKYENLPQPKVVGVKIEMDLYPEERDYILQGTYLMQNKNQEPIHEIHIQKYPDDQITLEVNFERTSVPDNQWNEFGYRIFKLEEPLLPGDSIEMNFLQTFETSGFVSGESNTRVVDNGTFLNNDYFPGIGYNRNIEMRDEQERRDAGLRRRTNQIAQTDSLGLHAARTGDDGYEIAFEATLSTSIDQIAVTSGSLEREWTKGDRRYFHYKMKEPMVNFYAIVSAEYQVFREKWRPEATTNEIDLEIYYHKGHDQNVQRMMDGMKHSLEYFSNSYGDYPYDHFRIMEFPRYRTFAQSFPGAVPFAESMGFRLDIDDQEDLDMVFYVTAHEVAHQWWGLQLIAATVEGRHALLESLAQYSALMITKRQFSEEKVAKFLKENEQKYLRERATEKKKEKSLVETYGQQYVHYSKGLLNFNHLQNRIPEDSINKALERLVNDWNFLDHPNTLKSYATFRDFLDQLDMVTPDSLKNLNRDLFEQITLHELSVDDVSYVETEPRYYELMASFEARKYHVDSMGIEQEVPPQDWIDIGIYAETTSGEELIELKTYFFDQPHISIDVLIDRKPSKVVIDPMNLFIEKEDRDNEHFF